MWKVELEGAPSDLARLPALFGAPECRIEQVESVFELTSTTFASYESHLLVADEARSLVETINAAVRLVFPSHQPISISVVRHTQRSMVIAQRRITFSLGISPIDHDPGSSIAPAWLTPALLSILHADELGRRVLLLLQAPVLEWEELYKLHEVVLSGGGAALLGKAGYSQSDLDRFTRTANSFGALGIAARHANERVPPPANPMPKAEATALVLRWVREWLVERANGPNAPDATT